MTTTLEQLSKFLSDKDDRRWLKDRHTMLYVRKSKRLYKMATVESLDLASFETIKDRGQGHMTNLILAAHELNPYRMTFIENVMAKRFMGHLLLLGFEVSSIQRIGKGGTVCFHKLK